MLDKNLITYIIIIIVIVIIIKKLSVNSQNVDDVLNTNQTKPKKLDSFDPNIKDKKSPNIVKIKKNHPDGYDLENAYLDTKACPIIDGNDYSNDEYVTRFLTETDQQKPSCNKVKSIKQFNNDFFKFRDNIENSSSNRIDPVDKINQLTIDSNLDFAKSYPNMNIKDVYDELTKAPDLYTKPYVRNPKFDDMNYDGWVAQTGSPGLILNQEEWKYNNEKMMNGGRIDGMVRASDKNDNMHLSLY